MPLQPGIMVPPSGVMSVPAQAARIATDGRHRAAQGANMNTDANNGTAARAQARKAIQTYARVAGVLFLITFAAGRFGEGYAPGQLIVANDAAATVANLKANDLMYRLSFAAYLVEALCDIALALIFYVLLKPVSRGLALLSAFFGVLSTALYAACEIFYFGLPQLLLRGDDYLKTFTPEQINTLTLLSLKLFNYGAGLFLVFYGTGWIIRGWLMIRSGYLPKLLGLLMILGGLGFVAGTVTQVLAPQYQTPYMLLALMPGIVLLALWLLVRGVNVAKWEAKATAAAGTII
jgi:Domain of unknown function (DUF4386)